MIPNDSQFQLSVDIHDERIRAQITNKNQIGTAMHTCVEAHGNMHQFWNLAIRINT